MASLCISFATFIFQKIVFWKSQGLFQEGIFFCYVFAPTFFSVKSGETEYQGPYTWGSFHFERGFQSGRGSASYSVKWEKCIDLNSLLYWFKYDIWKPIVIQASSWLLIQAY